MRADVSSTPNGRGWSARGIAPGCRPRYRLAVPVLIGLALIARADPLPAPFYHLPEDGRQVEFSWELYGGNDPVNGRMWLRSVGRVTPSAVPKRRLEIEIRARQGRKETVKVRQFVLDERAFAAGKPFGDCVETCIDRSDDRPPTRVTGARLADFLQLGLEVEKPGLRQVKADVPVETPVKTIRCRELSAPAKLAGRPIEYRAWTSDTVPFGLARLELLQARPGGKKTLLFRAELRKITDGAVPAFGDKRRPAAPE